MWTKTGDDYPERRLDLSDAAYRLEHVALTYCNRMLLDGRLPKKRLSLLPVPTRTRGRKVVEELLHARIWGDDGESFVIIGFFEDQPSAEEVRAQRAYGAVRQRIRFERSNAGKAALRKEEVAARVAAQEARQKRKTDAASQREADSASQAGSQRGSQRPAPPRPAPSEGEGEDASPTRHGPPAPPSFEAARLGLTDRARTILSDPAAEPDQKTAAEAHMRMVDRMAGERARDRSNTGRSNGFG